MIGVGRRGDDLVVGRAGADGSSGRPWNCWYLLLHITRRFWLSQSTKASEIVSTASRSRALASGERGSFLIGEPAMP